MKRIGFYFSCATLLLAIFLAFQHSPAEAENTVNALPDVAAAPTATFTPTPVTGESGSRSPDGQISPDDREFFLLTYPLAYKPNLRDPNRVINAFVWNGLIDHTPPFYNPGDHKLQPYTGEEATVPTQTPLPVTTRHPGTTPNNRIYYYIGHSGLDVDARTGTPVYASHPGVISFIGGLTTEGYGRRVELKDADNPTFITLYAHLNGFAPGLVSGSKVARGQLLGYSGCTGSGCGNTAANEHLHWGLYQGTRTDSPGYVLDPYGWFSQRTNNLGQGTPIPTDEKWANGYAPASTIAAVEPQNWNKGSLSGNKYILRNRTTTVTPAPIGLAPSGGSIPTVHPIEYTWTQNYGSIGAPKGAVFGSSGSACQYFEGGTLCENGQGGTNYSPVFTDIPITFWANRYVGWVANEQIASGYDCGSTGEPCDPENRAYFRPNAYMTRGQFSKVVSNLFSFSEAAGSQIYEDVLPGSTFYDFINRLSHRSIMGGYTCGGPGIPCVPPANRPYFRPENNLTRGQATKIIANSASHSDVNWITSDSYFNGLGPDFWDVPVGSTFYEFVQKLYNAGVVQYRVEDTAHSGQGGQYYVNSEATRAQICMFLHELLYASVIRP